MRKSNTKTNAIKVTLKYVPLLLIIQIVKYWILSRIDLTAVGINNIPTTFLVFGMLLNAIRYLLSAQVSRVAQAHLNLGVVAEIKKAEALKKYLAWYHLSLLEKKKNYTQRQFS